MVAQAYYIKGQTTRMLGQALIDGLPVDLTARDVMVRLAADDEASTLVTLTEGSGIGITDAANGKFWWDVTAANQVTLANPQNIWTAITIFNTDNTVAYKAQGYIEVVL